MALKIGRMLRERGYRSLAYEVESYSMNHRTSHIEDHVIELRNRYGRNAVTTSLLTFTGIPVFAGMVEHGFPSEVMLPFALLTGVMGFASSSLFYTSLVLDEVLVEYRNSTTTPSKKRVVNRLQR